MLVAFGLEGTAMTLWLLTRHTPVLFVLLSWLVFFGWGEIFSLFPSTLTDTFGTKHATANYGCLYMAQGVGSVLGGPVAALCALAATGCPLCASSTVTTAFTLCSPRRFDRQATRSLSHPITRPPDH